MTSLTQARDDINGRLKAAVDAYVSGGGVACPVFYDDLKALEADALHPHMRAFIKHNLGDQETLGGVGHRRFSRAGVMMVQVMTPVGDGFTLADTLATVARNAFEGVSTPNGVWFRKVVTKEIGVSGGFMQVNVTANFEYTETR